jgi:hypothetical protein
MPNIQVDRSRRFEIIEAHRFMGEHASAGGRVNRRKNIQSGGGAAGLYARRNYAILRL